MITKGQRINVVRHGIFQFSLKGRKALVKKANEREHKLCIPKVYIEHPKDIRKTRKIEKINKYSLQNLIGCSKGT